jgi:hypothetical protein
MFWNGFSMNPGPVQNQTGLATLHLGPIKYIGPVTTHKPNRGLQFVFLLLLI